MTTSHLSVDTHLASFTAQYSFHSVHYARNAAGNTLSTGLTRLRDEHLKNNLIKKVSRKMSEN